MCKILKFKKMKRAINIILLGTLMSVALHSCKGLDNGEEVSADNTIEINLSEDSRISKSFADGDEIGLYLVSSTTPGPKDLSAERSLNNVKFTMIGGKFISNPACSFPEDENMLNSIFVYYPYSENSVENGSKDMKVTVSYDQRANLEANDFIYGVMHDYKPQISRLNMSMKHALSKINIELKAGKGYTSVEQLGNPSILILNNIQEGYFDFSTVTPSTTYPRYDMNPNGFFTAKDNIMTGVSAILIPQTIKAGEGFIRLTINDQEYTYAPENDLVLSMGTESTFTLTINKGFDGVSVVMDDLGIEDWDVQDYEYDLTELSKPEGNTVTDIDGNVYDIVKIGEQYWMASNLRVTRLNDGTPIKKNERKLTEWGTYTEPAYVAYNFDESKVETYGYLYNKYNVYTEKICPEGWDVPTGSDWDILAESAGGKKDQYNNWIGAAKALKSLSWAPGTNATGFDALPAGSLFAVAGNPENTTFQGQGSTADWWSSTGNYTRGLSGKDDLFRYLSSEVFGASIRCIYNRKPIK